MGLLRVLRHCRMAEVDIIHSRGKGGGIYSRLAALLVGKPCIHTFHGVHTGQYNPLVRLIYRTVERCLSTLTNRVIAVSHGEAEQIITYRLAHQNKVATIPNGVEVPETVLEDRRYRDGILEIVVITRFDYQKFTEHVLDIAAELLRRGALNRGFDSECLELERASEASLLFVKVANLSRDVVFEGVVPRMQPFLANCFACLSTSRWEGMPLSLLEAMAQGTPVIASDVVGNRDVVVDGSSGLLFPCGDARFAATAILRLSDEPGLWEKLSRNSRRTARDRFLFPKKCFAE